MHSSLLLMLPVGEQISFISLKHKNKVHMFKNVSTTFRSSIPVGSSHGWLILLDETSEPYLVNPFEKTLIQLPSKITFPHITSITSKRCQGDQYLCVKYASGFSRTFGPREDILPLLSIKKVILSGNPNSVKDFVVVVLYGEESRIAYSRNGDRVWSQIQDGGSTYCDIACFDDSLFGLRENASVQIWDLKSMKKKRNFEPPIPRKLQEAKTEFPVGLYARKWYLVPCKTGQIFFVVRYIGEFVTFDGEVVYEEAIYEDQHHHPMICPYKTMAFHVFRLETSPTTTTWEEVKSLNDRVLFVGGNQSVSVLALDHPYCKMNSIYFTDDYWDRINEDYSYGGHDMGVFSLKGECVEQFLDLDVQKFSSPPFWIIP